jgi:hypothetical protein
VSVYVVYADEAAADVDRFSDDMRAQRTPALELAHRPARDTTAGNYQTKGRNTMKKCLIAGIAAAILVVPSAAMADTPPTYEQLQGNVPDSAQCGTGAGSGTFGWLGTFNDGTRHDFGEITENDSNNVPGANGYQTGLNNSGVCGNR